MRKIEEEMILAINDDRDWMKDNTLVVVSDHIGNPYLKATVYLHNNEIAEVLPDGTVEPAKDTFSRWPTCTTRSRLRALGVDASIKNGKPMINGEFI